jgi:hypothetical protein
MSLITASEPARRSTRRTVAHAALALVVLIGCGVMGVVATSASTAGGTAHDTVTAGATGRLSPDAIHSGWRMQPGSSARRVGHRAVGAPPSGSGNRRPDGAPSTRDGARQTSPILAASIPTTRGPPHTDF